MFFVFLAWSQTHDYCPIDDIDHWNPKWWWSSSWWPSKFMAQLICLIFPTWNNWFDRGTVDSLHELYQRRIPTFQHSNMEQLGPRNCWFNLWPLHKLHILHKRRISLILSECLFINGNCDDVLNIKDYQKLHCFCWHTLFSIQFVKHKEGDKMHTSTYYK